MLWTIFVILLVLWLLGVVTSYTLGGFIHVPAGGSGRPRHHATPTGAANRSSRRRGGGQGAEDRSKRSGLRSPILCPMFPYRDDNPTLGHARDHVLLIGGRTWRCGF